MKFTIVPYVILHYTLKKLDFSHICPKVVTSRCGPGLGMCFFYVYHHWRASMWWFALPLTFNHWRALNLSVEWYLDPLFASCSCFPPTSTPTLLAPPFLFSKFCRMGCSLTYGIALPWLHPESWVLCHLCCRISSLLMSRRIGTSSPALITTPSRGGTRRSPLSSGFLAGCFFRITWTPRPTSTPRTSPTPPTALDARVLGRTLLISSSLALWWLRSGFTSDWCPPPLSRYLWPGSCKCYVM